MELLETHPCIFSYKQLRTGGTDLNSVIKVNKRKKRDKKETAEKTKGKVSGGWEEGHILGCQCGGLMVAVPGLQAISLCYQVK